MRIFAFVPLLAIVACAESPMPTATASDRATASQTVNDKLELISIPMIACNGEVVVLSGTAHLRSNFEFTPSGNINTSFSLDYQLSGVGQTTGVKYIGSQKVTERAEVSSNSVVASNDVTMHLVAQGKVPNTVLGFRVMTVMANGELKMTTEDITTRCK